MRPTPRCESWIWTVAPWHASMRWRGRRGPSGEPSTTGTPWQLDLSNDEARLFDWNMQEDQWRAIERPLLRQLASAIAVGTFEELLRRIP